MGQQRIGKGMKLRLSSNLYLTNQFTSVLNRGPSPIKPSNPEIEQPEFVPRLDTTSKEFDFQKEIEWLPFHLNKGKDANLTWKQQSHFINMLYDNWEVFLLHD